jgi:hypothetical protein
MAKDRDSVWWIRLGILPLRIEPATPEQNGALTNASTATLEAEP